MWTPDPAIIITAEAKAEQAKAALLAQFSGAIQAQLDAKARERQYDSVQTAVSYRNDPNPTFAAEAEALFAWRSAVWSYSTTELGKVAVGERQVPTIEDFIDELPAFEWPGQGEGG
ncbi:hypothetical protein [Shinella sp. BYT-45]|uniref:hypothetical protein n=1 Tax=Shinella sp. BYT-45 TaxID=3377377 RepID=UPI00397F5281